MSLVDVYDILRSEDFSWFTRRIESYHRERLIAAGVPPAEVRIYRKPGMRGVLRQICTDHAFLLSELVPNPADVVHARTEGNRIPPPDRQLLHRAASFAASIIFARILSEPNGVTAARTAIFAGWQFVRWEGGRPMVEDAERPGESLGKANTEAADRIDLAIRKVQKTTAPRRKDKKGTTGNGRDQFFPPRLEDRIMDVLFDLFVLRGVCGAATAKTIISIAGGPAKLCHCQGPIPKDPQYVVDDTWYSDEQVYLQV